MTFHPITQQNVQMNEKISQNYCHFTFLKATLAFHDQINQATEREQWYERARPPREQRERSSRLGFASSQ